MRISKAYIEITNRCNLNCTTCYNRSGLNTVTREIGVTEVNGRTPAAFPPELIGIALLVNREFRRCAYSAEKAKKSDIYIQYERKIRETFPDAKGVI